MWTRGEPYRSAVRYEKQPDGSFVKIVERNTRREPENVKGNGLDARDWRRLLNGIGYRHIRDGCLFWNGPLSDFGQPVFVRRDGKHLNVRSTLWQHLEPGSDPFNGVRPFYKASCLRPRCIAYEHLRFVDDRPKRPRTAQATRTTEGCSSASTISSTS